MPTTDVSAALDAFRTGGQQDKVAPSGHHTAYSPFLNRGGFFCQLPLLTSRS